MTTRRTAAAEAPRGKIKQHGFRVGPANLPDGTYKRHNDRIKKQLIAKAQIKKQYAKIKKQTLSADGESHLQQEAAPVALHPDRAALVDSEEADPAQPAEPFHKNKARPTAFDKQSREAQQRKAEAEARRAAREASERERTERIAERERHRKIMAKSRPATGQRKLGLESKVLLDKVKRMIKKD